MKSCSTLAEICSIDTFADQLKTIKFGFSITETCCTGVGVFVLLWLWRV